MHRRQPAAAALAQVRCNMTRCRRITESALPTDFSRRSRGRHFECDIAVPRLLTATFVRDFLTSTPPLSAGEHAAARTSGQQRFEPVIVDIARRHRTERPLLARDGDGLR